MSDEPNNEPLLLGSAVLDARQIASMIREQHDRHKNVTDRERKAATLLLILADALVKARDDVRRNATFYGEDE